jgi:predicted PurR-regulated permease PerM
MLTEEEKKFVAYWQRERLKKKQYLRKLSIGLPLGVGIVLAVLASSLSGWYQRADMVLRGDGSVLIVIVIAIIAIVIFVTIFSARHQWDQNEQQYQSFLQKQSFPGAAVNKENESKTEL